MCIKDAASTPCPLLAEGYFEGYFFNILWFQFWSTLLSTNMAMENPQFWWYLPGKMGFSWAMLVSGMVPPLWIPERGFPKELQLVVITKQRPASQFLLPLVWNPYSMCLCLEKLPVWQVTVNNGVHDHKMMVNVDHFASKSTNHNSVKHGILPGPRWLVKFDTLQAWSPRSQTTTTTVRIEDVR